MIGEKKKQNSHCSQTKTAKQNKLKKTLSEQNKENNVNDPYHWKNLSGPIGIFFKKHN